MDRMSIFLLSLSEEIETQVMEPFRTEPLYSKLTFFSVRSLKRVFRVEKKKSYACVSMYEYKQNMLYLLVIID